MSDLCSDSLTKSREVSGLARTDNNNKEPGLVNLFLRSRSKIDIFERFSCHKFETGGPERENKIINPIHEFERRFFGTSENHKFDRNLNAQKQYKSKKNKPILHYLFTFFRLPPPPTYHRPLTYLRRELWLGPDAAAVVFKLVSGFRTASAPPLAVVAAPQRAGFKTK